MQSAENMQAVRTMQQAQLAKMKREAEEQQQRQALRDRLVARIAFDPNEGGATVPPGSRPAEPVADGGPDGNAETTIGIDRVSLQGRPGPWALEPSIPMLPQGQNPNAQRGAPLAGVNQMAALLALSGDPALAKLGGWIQDREKPLERCRGRRCVHPWPGRCVRAAQGGRRNAPDRIRTRRRAVRR
jgi:hypothetical protein